MSGFIGYGEASIADFDSGASFGLRGFRLVGNQSKLSYGFSLDTQEQKEYRTPAGGSSETLQRIDVVSGQLELLEFTPENKALAMWGLTSVVSVTPITGEAHVIRAGLFIPTEQMINTSVAPVVTANGSTTVDTADYIVSAGGILIASTITTATVSEDDPITIDYTPLASTDVQALLTTAPIVSIFFNGGNRVNGKKAVRRIHKAKLGAAQEINVIGSEFGSLVIPYTALRDTSIPDTGLLSQFISEKDET